jgi:hypothetical protein
MFLTAVPAAATVTTLRYVRPMPVRADTRQYASVPESNDTSRSSLVERFHVQNKLVRDMTLADLSRWEPFQSTENQMFLQQASDRVLDNLDYIRVMYDLIPLTERRKANLMRTVLNDLDKDLSEGEKALYDALIQYYGL